MPIENIAEIEQSLGIGAGKLTEMIASEEKHTIDISDFVISKKDDHETLINNHKKAARKEGLEIAVKKAREEHGLEFTGKNIANLLDSYKTKVESDANIKPNEKIAGLEEDKKKLQKGITDVTTEFDTFKSTVTHERQRRSNDSTLLQSMPDQEKLSIKKADILAIVNTRHKFNNSDDGFEILGADGKALKDDKLNLVKVDDFMTDFVKPYIKVVDGGRGDEDDEHATEGSIEAFEKEMKDKGITGEAFNKELQKRIIAKTVKV